jgi:Flp pilus assembly protein TadB
MTAPAMAIAMLSGGVAAAGVAALVVRPSRRLGPRVRPYTTATRARFGRSVEPGLSSPESPVARVVGPPATALLRGVGRLLERRADDGIVLALRQAGLGHVTADSYRTRTALHVLVFGGAGAGLGALVFHHALAALGLAICGALYGASRLRSRVDRAISDRRERIRLELYTVNQLLAIHIRTGAGPMQATQRIVDRGHGVVVADLRGVLDAVRDGIGEPEAFRHAAALTPEPAAARTYRLFAAGAERGVDLADGLRSLSEDLRDARREEIRQQATKRRAAMLVPTIAILAPVMLLFIAAPLPSIVFGSP